MSEEHRRNVAQEWEIVVTSELSPEDQVMAEALSPHVRAYLAGETERDEYERRIRATAIATRAGFPESEPSTNGAEATS